MTETLKQPVTLVRATYDAACDWYVGVYSDGTRRTMRYRECGSSVPIVRRKKRWQPIPNVFGTMLIDKPILWINKNL